MELAGGLESPEFARDLDEWLAAAPALQAEGLALADELYPVVPKLAGSKARAPVLALCRVLHRGIEPVDVTKVTELPAIPPVLRKALEAHTSKRAAHAAWLKQLDAAHSAALERERAELRHTAADPRFQKALPLASPAAFCDLLRDPDLKSWRLVRTVLQFRLASRRPRHSQRSLGGNGHRDRRLRGRHRDRARSGHCAIPAEAGLLRRLVETMESLLPAASTLAIEILGRVVAHHDAALLFQEAFPDPRERPERLPHEVVSDSLGPAARGPRLKSAEEFASVQLFPDGAHPMQSAGRFADPWMVGRIAPWLLMGTLGVVYIAAALNPHTGLFHDDGLYLATAESLATGHGYRIASLPGDPPQTKYPVLYPALLAALWPLAAGSAALFKIVSVLCTVVWTGAVFLLCRRLGLDRPYATWVAVTAVCGRWALFVFTAVLPDALFCALSTLALLHLMNIEDRAPPRWWAWPALAGIECGAAFLTRTVGATLIVAGILALGARRKFRELAVFALVAGILCAPWVLWQRTQPAPGDPVLDYYSKASYEHGSVLTQPGIARKTVVSGMDVVMLSTAFHVLLNTPVAWVGIAVSLVLTVVVLRQTIAGLRRFSPPALWLTLSVLVLAGWLGPPFRYLLPVFPVAAAFVALQLRQRPRIAQTLAAMIAICSVTTAAGAVSSLRAGRPVSWAATGLDDPAATARLFEWVRRNTPAGAVLGAANDPLAYQMTGRKAIRLFASDNYELLYVHRGAGVGTADDFLGHLRRHGIRYLLLTPMSGFSEGPPFRKVLADAEERRPDAFTLRYQDADTGYSVVEVRSGAILGK